MEMDEGQGAHGKIEMEGGRYAGEGYNGKEEGSNMCDEGEQRDLNRQRMLGRVTFRVYTCIVSSQNRIQVECNMFTEVKQCCHEMK